MKIEWIRDRIVCIALSLYSLLEKCRLLNLVGFEGDDLPFRIPSIDSDHKVMMEVEESVHYSLTGPEAHDEWMFGVQVPYGGGTYRVGTFNRTVVVSILFHQLYCVRTMHTLW